MMTDLSVHQIVKTNPELRERAVAAVNAGDLKVEVLPNGHVQHLPDGAYVEVVVFVPKAAPADEPPSSTCDQYRPCHLPECPHGLVGRCHGCHQRRVEHEL